MALNSIQTALYNKLESLAGLPEIFYPNIGGEPTGNYLVPFVLPANTEALGIRSTDRETGVFQVSIYVVKGSGELAASNIAKIILDGFPRNLDLTDVRIDRTGSIGPAIEDGKWRMLPVSITYNHIS